MGEVSPVSSAHSSEVAGGAGRHGASRPRTHSRRADGAVTPPRGPELGQHQVDTNTHRVS